MRQLLSAGSFQADTAVKEYQYRHALERIRADFLEMPGLQLTRQQVQRLSGVDSGLCSDVLEELVTSGLLYRSATGNYRRTSS